MKTQMQVIMLSIPRILLHVLMYHPVSGEILPEKSPDTTDKLGMNLFSAVVHIVRGLRVGG